MRFLLGLALLAAMTVPALADSSSAEIPITRVTLYTSGVGYFERSGSVDGDARKTLLFPVGQVNDVLKSLVLLDLGGGTIEPVTYGALDPVSRQLQSFSVDVSDNPDRATLFNRLRGASVTVSVSAPSPQTLTGIVVGVESQTVSLPNNATTQQSILNLFADDGMHAVALSSITSFQVNDPALRGELKSALATVAQGRDASKRPVTLDFAGRGRRSVVVGYLTETPLWQTSYRLVLGKTPQIQGWALVQNTGQDDWQDVTLSLVSGRPISFIQDLYTPTYVPRQVVQANVVGSPTPQTYGSNLDEDKTSIGGNTPATGGTISGAVIAGAQVQRTDTATTYTVSQKDEQVREPNPEGEHSPVKVTNQIAGAQVGTSLFAYDIKVPVSVPRQQSAMIPFLGEPIKTQSVSIYDDNTEADHPLSGVRLVNTTKLHLMGGPLTVFDQDASGQARYVGDALIDDTEPGQTRLISYAVDLAVDADVAEDISPSKNQAITIADGIVRCDVEQIATRTYTFKNNATQPRLIVIEQPNRGDGWSLIEPTKPDERTEDALRFDVPLAPKQSKVFKVVEKDVYSSGDTISGLDDNTIVHFSQEGEVSNAVKSALHEIVARRQAIAGTQAQIASISSALDALSAGQDRIRKNMEALDHGSALYKRYVTELDAQETRLADLQAQKEALQKQLTQEQADLASYVGKLTLE